jgi:hypothetical protein
VIRVAIVLAALAGVAGAAPDPRGAYVARALAAVRGLGAAGRDQLDRELYASARTRCHADSGSPTSTCLIDAARALCAAAADRPTCEAAADVLVVNLLSTDTFVDQVTRVRLVRGSTDYHAALAAELRRRYASLAAELALAGAGGDDAAAIDRMCRERDRAVHACVAGDTACIPSLPWSRCVAAVLWFVGGTS